MKLMEAIVQANHRAVSGDKTAGLRPDEFKDSLPLVALTCIDPRLDPILPEVLGIPALQFVWLRNAGNIVSGPLSSTMRSLALACAIKGGKEIAIIGHTDCKVRQTSVMQLTESLAKLGVDRSRLPDNLNEYFGLFASERQNVIKACDIVRSSPLVGPKIPVHGLVVDVETGVLEWIVDGYQNLDVAQMTSAPAGPTVTPVLESLFAQAATKIGDMEVYNTKIGEIVQKAQPLVTPVLEAYKEAKESTPPPPKLEETKGKKKEAVRILKPWVEAAKHVPWEDMAKRLRKK